MTTETFLELTRAEIEALKLHATPEEIAGLNFESLDPGNIHLCIYGQMTGYCFGPEASSLLTRCQTPVWFSGEMDELSASFDKPVFVEPVDNRRGDTGTTCLEMYIRQYPAENEQILQYLKGELDTLPELTLTPSE